MLDLNTQKSIRRMLDSINARKGRISKSTKTTFFIYIKQFCEFTKMTPDELIEDRYNDLDNKDRRVKRRHEEKLMQFAIKLREEGKTSNTVATAVGAIRSLYRSNYVPMTEVSVPSGRPERIYKIPTKKELAQVIDIAHMPWHGAFMTLTKDCGISLQDMLALKLTDGSPIYGSISDQLKKGQVPIHLNITREKTRIKYDTFLGEDSFEVLNNDAIFPDMASTALSHNKKLFPYSHSAIQDAMKTLGNKLGWTSFTPYSLRKWFRTQLTLSDMNEALIETMMGHSLGRVKEAYLVPAPQLLIEKYKNHYPALKL